MYECCELGQNLLYRRDRTLMSFTSPNDGEKMMYELQSMKPEKANNISSYSTEALPSGAVILGTL